MKIDRQPKAWIWKEFSVIGSQTELSILTNGCPVCLPSNEMEQLWQSERWWKAIKADQHPQAQAEEPVISEYVTLSSSSTYFFLNFIMGFPNLNFQRRKQELASFSTSLAEKKHIT